MLHHQLLIETVVDPSRWGRQFTEPQPSAGLRYGVEPFAVPIQVGSDASRFDTSGDDEQVLRVAMRRLRRRLQHEPV